MIIRHKSGQKMKKILNFLAVRRGGGLQNSLSFLKVLAEDSKQKEEYIAVVRKNSQIQQICKEHKIEFLDVVDNAWGRLKFELSCRSHFGKGQICFTFFGPPMLRSKGYLINIVGCAYSNLFYPEVNFWGHLKFFNRVKAELIDSYRKHVTACGDYWIFETDVLAKRAVTICNFPQDRVSVVKMTPSKLVSHEKVDVCLKTFFDNKIPKRFRFLFLSDAHPNKRQHLLPILANELQQLTKNFCFVTTMNIASEYSKKIMREISNKKLDIYFYNTGPVKPENVASLIDACNSICCFSVLESFSNNFVEAWRMGKVLIVTDADWAKNSCDDGALYVNLDDIPETARKMYALISNENYQKDLIGAGIKHLDTYPTASEKNQKYYECIQRAAELGECTEKKIKWPRKKYD